jgi:hypothetical protein
MDEKILSPSGHFTSEQFYPHFLRFKIISLKFQACFGQGPNIRGECFNHRPSHIRRPTTSTSQPTQPEMQHSKQWPWEARQVRCSVCSAKNKCRQNSDIQNAMWGCVLIPALWCTTHEYIFEECPTLCWEKWNTRCNTCNDTITSCMPTVLLQGNAYISYQSLLPKSIS